MRVRRCLVSKGGVRRQGRDSDKQNSSFFRIISKVTSILARSNIKTADIHRGTGSGPTDTSSDIGTGGASHSWLWPRFTTLSIPSGGVLRNRVFAWVSAETARTSRVVTGKAQEILRRPRVGQLERSSSALIKGNTSLAAFFPKKMSRWP